MKKDRSILIIALVLFIGLFPLVIRSATAATAVSTLSLDGSASGGCQNTSSSCSATLSTQHGNDIVIAFAVESLNAQIPCGFSVSDTVGLFWMARSTIIFDLTGRSQMQEFWAKSIAPLASDVVTESITGCGNNYNTVLVFGISGANFNNPFDPNNSLPGTASGNSGDTSVQVSTSNPNDMIFAAVSHGSSASSPTPEPGFAIVTTAGPLNVVEYEIVDTTATNMAVTFSDAAAADWISIADAVQAQSLLPPPALNLTPSNGTVGTKVLVQGTNFEFGQAEILITFDDQLVGFTFSQNGVLNFTFNVPLAQPGPHAVKAIEPSVTSNSLIIAIAPFQVLPAPTSLSVSVTTGAIYFPGDKANLFIIVTQNGRPTTISDLQLTLLIITPAGSVKSLSVTSVQRGVYSASFAIPSTTSLGTYTIVLNAISPTAGESSAIASFLVKPAWIAPRATAPTAGSILVDFLGSHAMALTAGVTWVGLVSIIGVAWQEGHFKKMLAGESSRRSLVWSDTPRKPE